MDEDVRKMLSIIGMLLSGGLLLLLGWKLGMQERRQQEGEKRKSTRG